MAEPRVRSTAAQLFAEEEEEAAVEAAKNSASIPVYDRVWYLIFFYKKMQFGLGFYLFQIQGK